MSIRRFTHRPSPWLVVSVLLALTLCMAAADRPAPRIAIVDANRINQESSYVRDKLKKISAPTESIQQQLVEKKKQLQSAIEAFQAQSSAMSEDARRKKSEEINRLRGEADALSQSYTQAFDRALNNPSGENLAEVHQTIMNLVTRLAVERQLDVVISTDGVLYHAPQVDLTGELIRRLDAASN